MLRSQSNNSKNIAEEKRNRLKQIFPEVFTENKIDKAAYNTIADIGKERIRRAARKIKEAHPENKNLDLGFKVFKLHTSIV